MDKRCKAQTSSGNPRHQDTDENVDESDDNAARADRKLEVLR